MECLDSTGKPVKGVRVEALSLNGLETKDEKSNGDGIAEFKDLEDGVYRVVGRKKNYAPVLHEFVTIQSATESVSLAFEAGDAEALLYFEDDMRIQRAFELMNQGVNASKEARFDDAAEDLLQSVELNPASSQALYFLGMSYIQTRNFDKAVEILEKTQKLSGMFAALPAVPGVSDPAQQKEINKNAQRLISNMALIKGQLALEQKKYDEAISAFTEGLNKNPNDPELHMQLAIALTYAGQLDQAMNTIDKAIQLKPDEKIYSDLKQQIAVRIENAAIKEAQASLYAGNDLLQAGDPAGALNKFQEAITLLPPDKQSIVWKQIGKAQVELEQPAAAEDAYKKAVELAPEKDAGDYSSSLMQFYVQSKKYDEALDALTDPRALGNKSAETALLDLVDKVKNDNYVLAEAALERVIAINPENAEACLSLGQMYYADGKEKDGRTKVLLAKYIEIGQDQDKISRAKDMLTIVNRRSK